MGLCRKLDMQPELCRRQFQWWGHQKRGYGMIGILIGDIRKKSGVRAEQLARGICSVGMLRLYETGNREPEKLLADAFLQRLGKSEVKYDITLDCDEYLLASKRAKIAAYICENRLEEVENLIRAYSEENVTEKVLHRQYLCLAKAELFRRKKEPIEKQEENILKGLAMTIEEASNGMLKPELLSVYRFSLMELLLLQRFAVIQEKKGNCDDALLWHQKILEYFEPIQLGNKRIQCDNTLIRKVYPFSAYWLAKGLERRDNCEEALKMIEAGRTMLSVAANQSSLFMHLMELKFRISNRSGKNIPNWEKNCLELIRDAVGIKYDIWGEDWYPFYFEGLLHTANELVSQRRKIKGLTEAELASGICDVRAISRAETGEHITQKKIKDALLARLGVSSEKYDGGIVTKRYEDYLEYSRMISAYNSGKYEEAYQHFGMLFSSLNPNYISNAIWYAYWNTLIQRHLVPDEDKNWAEQLWKILMKTLPLREDNISYLCDLTEYERMILGQLFWANNVKGKGLLDSVLNQQYSMLQKSEEKRLFFKDYYQVVVYGYAWNLCRCGEEEVAEQIVQENLTQLCCFRSDEQWGRMMWLAFLIEKAKKEAENQSLDEASFRWVRYSYAISKYYMDDIKMVKYLENKMEKEYPEYQYVLKELTEE